MKTTLYKQQKNNFTKGNKTTCIRFAILAALISHSVFANRKVDEKSNTASNSSAIVVVSQTNTILFKKPVLAIAFDTTTMTVGYTKTIEDVIKEDNLIIESTINQEAFPLDFDKLYKRTPKKSKNKRQNSFSKNSSLPS